VIEGRGRKEKGPKGSGKKKGGREGRNDWHKENVHKSYWTLHQFFSPDRIDESGRRSISSPASVKRLLESL
jgi:hypothetical protein